jgi:hypothetical protein
MGWVVGIGRYCRAVDHEVIGGDRRSWRTWLPDSRLIVAAMLGAYFLLFVAVGGHQHWADLGVSPTRFTFLDLRSVTSGWECTRRHIHVLPTNPCDPLDRPANYPAIWMAPAFLGLGQGSTFVLGVLVAVVFFLAALAVLSEHIGAIEAVVYGIALCSPAVMLGVERGNVDLLVFALLVPALLVLRRSERSMLVGQALLLFTAILKLFPIFAAAVLLRGRRRRPALIGFSVVVGCFLIYAFLTRANLRAVERALPQVDAFSYGVRLFTEWLAAGLDSIVNLPLAAWDSAVAALVVGAALVGYRGGRGALPRASGPAAERDLDLFIAGAAIYICSYVLLRNFEYRLAFLLLTLPQLFRWARAGRPLAVVSIVALLGTLWFDELLVMKVPLLGRVMRSWNSFSTFAPFNVPLPAAVLMQAVLFAALTCCLVAVVPRPGWRRSTTPESRLAAPAG